MDVVAVQNLRAADRLLGAPTLPAVARINLLGHDEARLLLRHLAAEQNRWYAEQWEWVQLATGLVLILLLVFGSRPPKVAIGLCLVMFLIVLVSRAGLTPWINRVGPQTDFLPAGSQLPGTFATFRSARFIMELVKLALGFGVAGLLLLRKPADPRMFVRESEIEEAATRRFPK